MSLLTDYSDRNATKEVIGCLMQQPSLIKKHKIDFEMFAEKFYQYIFLAIEHLVAGGAKLIDTAAIEDYLEQYPAQFKNFKANNGEELLLNIEESSTLENFDYNLGLVKKFALLRDLKAGGFDVSEFYDPDETASKIIERKRAQLRDMELDDIIIHFSHKQRQITSKFENRMTTETKKAGVDGLQQLEYWKNNVEWGLGYASAYLNSILYGIRQRHYVVKSCGSGTGKALPNYAKIPTPNGWRTVGDIKEGDYLFDAQGKPTKVLQIHPQAEEKDIWKISFLDGREVECCKDHLWTFAIGPKSRRKNLTKTTEDFYNFLEQNKDKNQPHKRIYVQINKPVQYEAKQYSVDPYVMGALLGDGSFRCNKENKALSFSSQNDEIPLLIAQKLGEYYPSKNKANNYTYIFKPKNNIKHNLWVEELLKDYPDLWNIKTQNKFIPNDYLIGSVEQRLELLKGLLDTDGSIDKKGRISFYTISPLLKDNVIELCYSLGMMASVGIDTHKQYSENQGVGYYVHIQCAKNIKPLLFDLNRKKKIAIEYANNNRRQEYRDYMRVTNIQKTNKKTQMTCFTVDNEEHLFLTNDYIVTHNTRTTISDICHAFVPKYYDKKSGEWCVNPNGINNRCLYIGTEMELLTEIDPILWAYIADVPQDHIKFNQYEDDEEERVKEAIRILEEEGNIYLAYCPDYTVEELTRLIEDYKVEHNITAVFFDYIHTTGNLIAEFSNATNKHMAVREDLVLADLSTKLKNICRKYNISFDTCTQVNGDSRKTENKDESIVRGAKSIIDKCDVAMIGSRPTEKELKLIDNYLRVATHKGKVSAPIPNMVYSIYKNRDGKYNEVKVWLYIDYSTMRTHDLFVTDYHYKIIKDFPKVYVNEQKKGRITYDEGETIYVKASDEINAQAEEIKKDIELDDYENPVPTSLEEEQEKFFESYVDENGVGYELTEEDPFEGMDFRF